MNKQFIYLGIVVLLAVLAGYLFATQPIRRGLDVQGGLRMTLRAEIEKLSQRNANCGRLSACAR